MAQLHQGVQTNVAALAGPLNSQPRRLRVLMCPELFVEDSADHLFAYKRMQWRVAHPEVVGSPVFVDQMIDIQAAQLCRPLFLRRLVHVPGLIIALTRS